MTNNNISVLTLLVFTSGLLIGMILGITFMVYGI